MLRRTSGSMALGGDRMLFAATDVNGPIGGEEAESHRRFTCVTSDDNIADGGDELVDYMRAVNPAPPVTTTFTSARLAR
jgi:hypothetical protein